MILISHRGNTEGCNEKKENSPDYIDNAISLGFDVEIDVRYLNGDLYLGHDLPQYKINLDLIRKIANEIKNMIAIPYDPNDKDYGDPDPSFDFSDIWSNE